MANQASQFLLFFSLSLSLVLIYFVFPSLLFLSPYIYIYIYFFLFHNHHSPLSLLSPSSTSSMACMGRILCTRSFCNEGGCSGSAEAGGDPFKAITYEIDGTRPVLANMNSDLGGLLSHVIDVQGFSHSPRSVVDAYHKKFPEKPLYMSECCSCVSDRGQATTNSSLSDFNANCIEAQTNVSDAVSYVVGSMVWTLFDYYGEPCCNAWPRVSSSFGQFDLAGFPKSAAHWYR